jgi:hypothetical protein
MITRHSWRGGAGELRYAGRELTEEGAHARWRHARVLEKGGCVFNEARVVGVIHRVAPVLCHPSQPLAPPGRLGGGGPRRRLR